MITSEIIEIRYGGLKLLGFLTPMAKGKCMFSPNPQDTDKTLLDGGVGTLHEVLADYMGEAAWPAKPT